MFGTIPISSVGFVLRLFISPSIRLDNELLVRVDEIIELVFPVFVEELAGQTGVQMVGFSIISFFDSSILRFL